ncbi:DUF2971 domain-containing protein [Thalassolituus oleivorans]|uniref:DUF2971 domain-containing protein n=1 Tax=Thalassolituus oleivorans TaxID=187493 RepID=UPI0023F02E5C|nr:DUF2971 domain-containing protein [Thalassolituus oleivorans]
MKLYRVERPDQFRIETLKRNEIWMARPESFNDPLDCRLTINDKTEHSTFNEENIKSAAKSLYEDYKVLEGAWLITDDILKNIESWVSGHDETLALDGKPYFLTLIENRILEFGLQCFSETGYKNPLMWAHYALNHKGFCIEYEYEAWTLATKNSFDFSMSPAIYTSKLPEFNLMEVLFSPREVTTKLYASKSEHWSYEREYRLVYFPCSPAIGEQGQSVPLPRGLKVTKIIAGLNSRAIKNELEIAAKSLDIPILQIKLSNSNYDLEI